MRNHPLQDRWNAITDLSHRTCIAKFGDFESVERISLHSYKVKTQQRKTITIAFDGKTVTVSHRRTVQTFDYIRDRDAITITDYIKSI